MCPFVPNQCFGVVSTHSRPKAAGRNMCNTSVLIQFQHTAARRRLHGGGGSGHKKLVSTHSRPKAAAQSGSPSPLPNGVSTHSRPKAAV